jgi:hypothetical protein
MGTMAPDDLARLWRHEQLSTEMAIGHVIQHIVRLHHALDSQRQLLHASLEQQRQLLLALEATLPALPDPSLRTKKRKRSPDP